MDKVLEAIIWKSWMPVMLVSVTLASEAFAQTAGQTNPPPINPAPRTNQSPALPPALPPAPAVAPAPQGTPSPAKPSPAPAAPAPVPAAPATNSPSVSNLPLKNPAAEALRVEAEAGNALAQ